METSPRLDKGENGAESMRDPRWIAPSVKKIAIFDSFGETPKHYQKTMT